jgi:hypothetical protein
MKNHGRCEPDYVFVYLEYVYKLRSCPPIRIRAYETETD